jgi:cytidylate kinase
MIIAIDGPAAAGKSTVARGLARALGLAFLDTGAMYRAVTLAALRRGIDPADGQALGRLARGLALELDAEGRLHVDGEPAEPAIRRAEVTAHVSQVSAHPAVRAAIVPLQRAAAARGPGVVAEGRDIGTVVFPDAEHKFFLVASSAERARRRARQEGREGEVEALRAEIERRDRHDATRADSPLVRAPDALEVSTDGRTADEVLALLLERVRSASAGEARR